MFPVRDLISFLVATASVFLASNVAMERTIAKITPTKRNATFTTVKAPITSSVEISIVSSHLSFVMLKTIAATSQMNRIAKNLRLSYRT